jgi:hypothetical protein
LFHIDIETTFILIGIEDMPSKVKNRLISKMLRAGWYDLITFIRIEIRNSNREKHPSYVTINVVNLFFVGNSF